MRTGRQDASSRPKREPAKGCIGGHSVILILRVSCGMAEGPCRPPAARSALQGALVGDDLARHHVGVKCHRLISDKPDLDVVTSRRQRQRL